MRPTADARSPYEPFASVAAMTRILVTGMSGTGKSSALVELGRRGYRVVDTDDPGWRVYREYADKFLKPEFIDTVDLDSYLAKPVPA